MSCPIHRDDGTVAVFEGYRVQHHLTMGPTKCGTRFAPSVDIGKVAALAIWMSWKCALVGLPYGGAKGGVNVDLSTISRRELESLSGRYMQEMIPFVGPHTDVMAPDMGTNEQVMAWFMDTYSMYQGQTVTEIVTGKPVSPGGTLGRREATDARALGYSNWRVTEGVWREMPDPGARGQLAFTVPPVWPTVAAGFFAAQATEDLVGGGLQPAERQVLRWYCLCAYPEGVSEAEGERWFVDTHAPELARAGGAWRIFSTRAHKQPLPLPGGWPQGRQPPPHTVLHRWDRLTELWFESFDDWRGWMREWRPA